MTFLVKIYIIYPKIWKYLIGWKDSKWMNDILSSYNDLHLNNLINSFMHSLFAEAASQPMG